MITPAQPKPPRVGPTDHVKKKVSLWHTPTFRPLTDPSDLDEVMATLGFVPDPVRPDDVWREFHFHSSATGVEYGMLLPRPRMPAERMDGWHLDVYKKFLEDAEFYVGAERVYEHIHIRGMPLDQVDNLAVDNAFKELKEDSQIKDELAIFVFRDTPSDDNYLNNSIDENFNNTDANLDISTEVGNNKTDNNNGSITFLVPLKDIFGELKS